MWISQIHLDFSPAELQLNQSLRCMWFLWISNEIHRACKKNEDTLYSNLLSDPLTPPPPQSLTNVYWIYLSKCCKHLKCTNSYWESVCLVTSNTRSNLTIYACIIYTSYLLSVGGPFTLTFKSIHNVELYKLCLEETHIDTWRTCVHENNDMFKSSTFLVLHIAPLCCRTLTIILRSYYNLWTFMHSCPVCEVIFRLIIFKTIKLKNKLEFTWIMLQSKLTL